MKCSESDLGPQYILFKFFSMFYVTFDRKVSDKYLKFKFSVFVRQLVHTHTMTVQTINNAGKGKEL